MVLERIKSNKWFFLALILFWITVFVRTGIPGFSASAFSVISFTVFLLLFLLSFLTVFFLKNSLLNNFLFIAVLLGIFYVILEPFACGIDEEYHFMRAFDLTNLRILPERAGAYVPQGYETYAMRESWTIRTVPENLVTWMQSGNSLTFIERIRSASYLPFAYIPAATGIAVARLFNLPVLGVVLLARLFNYAFYVAVCSIAISKTKKLQSLIFLMALSTGSLITFGIVHIDSVLISCSLLYVSLCFHYIFDEEPVIKKADIVLLCCSAFLFSTVKYLGYAFILPLIFFIPKETESRKQAVISVFSVLLLAAVLQLVYLLRYRGSLDNTGFENVNTAMQLKDMIARPAHTVSVIFSDIIGNLYERLFQTYQTGSLFNVIACIGALFPMLLSAVTPDKPYVKGKKAAGIAVFCLAAALVMQILITVSLYLSWTPVGSDTVLSVHPRYSLPFFVLVMTVLSFLPVKSDFKKWPETISFMSVIIVLNALLGLLTAI